MEPFFWVGPYKKGPEMIEEVAVQIALDNRDPTWAYYVGSALNKALSLDAPIFQAYVREYPDKIWPKIWY